MQPVRICIIQRPIHQDSSISTKKKRAWLVLNSNLFAQFELKQKESQSHPVCFKKLKKKEDPSGSDMVCDPMIVCFSSISP